MNLMLHRPRATVAALLAVVALGGAGCDGLLEENPLSTITPVNFYATSDDALTAIISVYSSFSYTLNNQSFAYMIEGLTPQAINRRPTNHTLGCWDALRCEPSNSAPAGIWNDSYSGINRANAVLGNVPDIDMDATEKARILAEAKFLRALHYFQLVRLFGGVPLFEEQTRSLGDVARARATADEVYALIIADLEAAKGDLPVMVSEGEFGRATRGAAQTLLGMVYLQRGAIGQSNPYSDPTYWPTAQPGDLDAAIAEFRDVVNSGQYALVDDYASLWRPETEVNSEAIFSIRFASMPGLGAQGCTYAAPLNSTMCYRQFAAWGGEVPFVESYAADDVRQESTWILEFVGTDGQLRTFDFEDVMGDNYGREFPASGKYVDRASVSGVPHVQTGPQDFLFLRYGDVLLSLAEALWRKSPGSAEALGLVNQIRERAGVDPLDSLTEEALYWERAWELASEQKGWYDGARFWELFKAHVTASSSLRETQPEKYQGQSVPVELPYLDEPRIRLIAIPQSALDLNPSLVQNPGY